jgi:hypothetical protein
VSEVPKQIPARIEVEVKRREAYERLVGKEQAERNDRRRMETVSLYLHPHQVDALKELQEATRVPTSVRIRDGIDAILNDAIERGTLG